MRAERKTCAAGGPAARVAAAAGAAPRWPSHSSAAGESLPGIRPAPSRCAQGTKLADWSAIASGTCGAAGDLVSALCSNDRSGKSSIATDAEQQQPAGLRGFSRLKPVWLRGGVPKGLDLSWAPLVSSPSSWRWVSALRLDLSHYYHRRKLVRHSAAPITTVSVTGGERDEGGGLVGWQSVGVDDEVVVGW